jgi:hypothetical protein
MPSKSVAWIQDNGHRPGSVHLGLQVVHSSSWGKHAFRRISTPSLLWDHWANRRSTLRPDVKPLIYIDTAVTEEAKMELITA